MKAEKNIKKGGFPLVVCEMKLRYYLNKNTHQTSNKCIFSKRNDLINQWFMSSKECFSLSCLSDLIMETIQNLHSIKQFIKPTKKYLDTLSNDKIFQIIFLKFQIPFQWENWKYFFVKCNLFKWEKSVVCGLFKMRINEWMNKRVKSRQ